MNQIKLNAIFVNNILATFGVDGKIWLDNLSVHLEQLSAQWHFQMVQPIENLSYHFVAIVKWQSKLAILKMAPAKAPLLAEAEWLKAHKKSVPIIFHMDQKNNAYLMQKLQPGTSLKHLVKEGYDEKATRILAEVILDLHAMNALHKTNYHSISEHIISFSFLRGYIDNNMIHHAESVFNELCADDSQNIILHGDLHHDNILQHEGAWCVIDPHGYWGDPCAEMGPMIYNPIDCFPNYDSLSNIIETRLNILAEMLPFDIKRMKAWAFCLALRSAAWDIESFGKPNSQTIEIAKFLYSSAKL